MGRTTAGVLLCLAAVAAACGPSASPQDDGRIRVVATSTVFADLVARTGGDAVEMTSLVPAGVDVHTYQATPADLRAVAEADLLVMNGLGLDDWLATTIESANPDAPILTLGTGVPADELIAEGGSTAPNPHVWLDVEIAGRYVEAIGRALVELEPGAAADADAYRAALADLDAWVREQMATIPEANRRIVTFHDALPYFARAYGLEVVGVAVEAPGQDPSAGEIAALIDAIREAGVRAIFSEDQFPTAVVDQLARETGAEVVANLFTDSLGDPPVTSYEALIRWDVERFVEALR